MDIQYRRQLVFLMRQLNLPLVAAELGTAEGLFSRDLLHEGLEKLYSVDNWACIEGQKGDGGFEQQWHDKNYAETKERLKTFGEKSVILKGLSYQMAENVPDNSIGLLYIDCDHSYEGVTNDIESWYDKVVSGGLIAFHDYENTGYGVKQAVNDFCESMGITDIHLLSEDKPEDAGAFFIKP